MCWANWRDIQSLERLMLDRKNVVVALDFVVVANPKYLIHCKPENRAYICLKNLGCSYHGMAWLTKLFWKYEMNRVRESKSPWLKPENHVILGSCAAIRVGILHGFRFICVPSLLGIIFPETVRHLGSVWKPSGKLAAKQLYLTLNLN